MAYDLDLSIFDAHTARIMDICENTRPAPGLRTLLSRLNKSKQEPPFESALTRGGWYRLGGVVDASGHRLAEDLTDWIYEVSGGNLATLFDEYANAGLQVTKLVGCTHYLVAPFGSAAAQFVQLEVEEVQESIIGPLFSSKQRPAVLEDLTDIERYPSRTGQPLGAPRYFFRRMSSIQTFLDEMFNIERRNTPYPDQLYIQRFFEEWDQSSAAQSSAFCKHWVLMLREHRDSNGEPLLAATPTPTYQGKLPDCDLGEDTQGIKLAALLNRYDKALGYPFAWYFSMVTHPQVPHVLAERVYGDINSDYDYLPHCDAEIVKRWLKAPYCL